MMSDLYMMDRANVDHIRHGMEDMMHRRSKARVVGGYSGGALNAWSKAVKEVAENYRHEGKKFSLKNRKTIAEIRYLYDHVYNVSGHKELAAYRKRKGRSPVKRKRITKRKRSGSKSLTGRRHKALRKTKAGRCSVYEPYDPQYWKENDGRCIKYSTHLKKMKKPKRKVGRKKGGVFIGRGEGEGEGVLLGGCGDCPYCGDGMY